MTLFLLIIGLSMAEIKSVDINSHSWPFFDSALLLKMLDFHIGKGTHDKQKLLGQKLKVISGTNMNSNARSVYKELYNHENYPACKTDFLIYE